MVALLTSDKLGRDGGEVCVLHLSVQPVEKVESTDGEGGSDEKGEVGGHVAVQQLSFDVFEGAHGALEFFEGRKGGFEVFDGDGEDVEVEEGDQGKRGAGGVEKRKKGGKGGELGRAGGWRSSGRFEQIWEAVVIRESRWTYAAKTKRKRNWWIVGIDVGDKNESEE